MNIQVDHVTFTYPGASEPALKNVSLTVAHGERLGILGPDIAPPQVMAGGGADVLVEWMPAALAAREKGLVLELLVDEGDAVKAGDLLARLDDTQLALDLEVLGEIRGGHRLVEAQFQGHEALPERAQATGRHLQRGGLAAVRRRSSGHPRKRDQRAHRCVFQVGEP